MESLFTQLLQLKTPILTIQKSGQSLQNLKLKELTLALVILILMPTIIIICFLLAWWMLPLCRLPKFAIKYLSARTIWEPTLWLLTLQKLKTSQFLELLRMAGSLLGHTTQQGSSLIALYLINAVVLLYKTETTFMFILTSSLMLLAALAPVLSKHTHHLAQTTLVSQVAETAQASLSSLDFASCLWCLPYLLSGELFLD